MQYACWWSVPPIPPERMINHAATHLSALNRLQPAGRMERRENCQGTSYPATNKGASGTWMLLCLCRGTNAMHGYRAYNCALPWCRISSEPTVVSKAEQTDIINRCLRREYGSPDILRHLGYPLRPHLHPPGRKLQIHRRCFQ